MAYRKNRPALYELLREGNVKPNRDGRMSTPRWFYPGKVNKSASEQQAPETDQESRPQKQSTKTATLRGGVERIEFSVTRQVLILAGVGLLLSYVAVYFLGQGGGGSDVEPVPSGQVANEAGLSYGDIQASPVRNDIAPERTQAMPPRVETIRPAQAKLPKPRVTIDLSRIGETATPAEPKVETRPTDGVALVLCGYSSPRELRPVQQYFNQNGIPTEIGKRAGVSRYELYTLEVFDSRRNVLVDRLKQRIARVGQGYNANRPKTALSFNEDTFMGAFPVNVKDMVPVDRVD